ncbi:hypothetical protein BT69DRAFT_1338520 [Atractiella rhizophila]|nr:hypothetical protein BT69DRAFT_1338520 [Atractiella rhizophila]
MSRYSGNYPYNYSFDGPKSSSSSSHTGSYISSSMSTATSTFSKPSIASSKSSNPPQQPYQSPFVVKTQVVLEPSVMEKLAHNITLLQVILEYKFQTERGLDCGKEALLHSTATTLPEGNLRLARLGEVAMKTMGLERLYLEGNATGVNVTAQDHKFSIQNLCKISKEFALPSLIIVGNSKPGISDRMSAQVLQATLGAVYIDGRMEALERVMTRLGL